MLAEVAAFYHVSPRELEELTLSQLGVMVDVMNEHRRREAA